MTLALMKALAPIFSISRLSAAIVASSILSAPCAWAATIARPSSPLPDDVAANRQNPGSSPNFCQIPPRPTDVRKAGAFKQAVVAIRLSGVHLVAQTAPGTFSLEDTDGFASDARALATPPAPMTPLDGQQTPAFTDQARALARPPGPR